MSKKTPFSVAARTLQDETGAPYVVCLHHVREHLGGAQTIKATTGKPFAECLADAARPFVQKEK